MGGSFPARAILFGCGFVFSGIVSAAALPVMTPLDVSGWDYDGIADAGSMRPNGSTTGTLELYRDYFEKGFDPAHPNIGLPAGKTFQSALHSTTTFQIQPANGNNLLLLGGFVSPAPSSSGTLTFTAPTLVSELAVLDTGFNGNHVGTYILNYASGTAVSGPLSAADNFQAGPVAISGFGRFRYDNLQGLQEDAGTPRLFDYDIPVDPTRPLVSVTFSYAPSGSSGFNGPPEIGIFGLSGSQVSLHPGDANGDGMVNFADLLILAQNYGKSVVQTFSTGDFNGDGRVGFDDLLILAQNYGFGTGAAAASAVPEPSMAALSLIGSAIGLRRRH